MNFYNDNDKTCALWIKNLINEGEIADGYVCDSSIFDINHDDLKKYNQCHFFTGIGGWPLALRLAGYEDLTCWTGSPPCQPFSQAGYKKGINDERHLAPIFINLIKKGKPPIIFGEQVATAIAYGWLDEIFDALESFGYVTGAAVLPACCVGSPQIRNRLFFGAWLANPDRMYVEGRGDNSLVSKERQVKIRPKVGLSDDSLNSHWRKDSSVIQSEYDQKNRLCKSGADLLVNGFPGIVGQLRAFGNSLVPQVAATFVSCFMQSIKDYNEIIK